MEPIELRCVNSAKQRRNEPFELIEELSEPIRTLTWPHEKAGFTYKVV
jgi:hypothetical protein